MLGDFVLGKPIGKGGFGTVYRCSQPVLGREAVVKVLHQRMLQHEVALERFKREARLASRLDHPFAAHVYAAGVESKDGLVWIAMELVKGTTLSRWLRTHGPMPLEQLVPFFERVAEVVQAAHERGIVHRDIKPSNIMVMERAGRLLPKMLDDTPPPAALPQPLLPARDGQTLTRTGDTAASTIPDRMMATEPGTSVPDATPSPPGVVAALTRTNATLGSPPYM